MERIMNFIIRPSKIPNFDAGRRSLTLRSDNVIESVNRDLAIYHSEKLAELLVNKPNESAVTLEKKIRINFLFELLTLGEVSSTPAELDSYLTALDFLQIPYSLQVKYDAEVL